MQTTTAAIGGLIFHAFCNTSHRQKLALGFGNYFHKFGLRGIWPSSGKTIIRPIRTIDDKMATEIADTMRDYLLSSPWQRVKTLWLSDKF